MKTRPLIGLFAIVALLSACAPSFKPADALIAHVRELTATGDYEAIYALGTDAFKARGGKDEVAAMVEAAAQLTADCDPPNRTSTSFLTVNGASRVTETFARACPHSDVTETFVIAIDHGAALLDRYQVHSAQTGAEPAFPQRDSKNDIPI